MWKGIIETYHCTSFTPAIVSNEYCLAVLDVGEGTSLIKLQRKGNLSSDAEPFNSTHTHHASSLVSHAPGTDHVLGDGLGHGGPALHCNAPTTPTSGLRRSHEVQLEPVILQPWTRAVKPGEGGKLNV